LYHPAQHLQSFYIQRIALLLIPISASPKQSNILAAQNIQWLNHRVLALLSGRRATQ
jgi:hypothetical protein